MRQAHARSAAILFLFAFSLFACSSDYTCRSDIEQFDVLNFDAYTLRDVTPTSYQLNRAFTNIGSCVKFKESDGSYTSYELEYIAAKSYKERTILIFDLKGISDLSLVYYVTKDGDIIGKFKNGGKRNVGPMS